MSGNRLTAGSIALLFSAFFIPSEASAQLAEPDGGGAFEPASIQDQITETERAAIWSRLQTNRNILRKRGVLPTNRIQSAGLPPLFSWPTRSTTSDPGHFGISNFVDHDPASPDKISDYQCGTRSYDLSNGYDHKGLDVFSWPFPWLKMDRDEVEIIAAAPGIILDKDDGNFDRNCSFTGSWNAVYIEHADGSVAWYGHLKKNSLTPKSIGDSVAAGEFLGVMGSSGQSTGPHLHLEVYDSNNQLIDPFTGVCNTLNDSSWWQDQPDYYQSRVNLIATHDSAPSNNNGCGITETPNFNSSFNPLEEIFFVIYLQDLLAEQQLVLTVTEPGGDVWRNWAFSRSQEHYSASWWYWSWFLPDDAESGQWTFSVEFGEQTETIQFQVVSSMFEDGFEAIEN